MCSQRGRPVRRRTVTSGSVAALLAEFRVPPEPDLLSLDIDGNDWHVLRAVWAGGWRPAVVVVEFNAHAAYARGCQKTPARLIEGPARRSAHVDALPFFWSTWSTCESDRT